MLKPPVVGKRMTSPGTSSTDEIFVSVGEEKRSSLKSYKKSFKIKARTDIFLILISVILKMLCLKVSMCETFSFGPNRLRAEHKNEFIAEVKARFLI
jgi:hypothetical protein